MKIAGFIAVTVPLSLAATACTAETAPAGKPSAEAPVAGAAATPAPAPSTLAGHWRVAGIDGEPLNESYGLALSADEQEIWWEPRCAGYILGYTIEGNAFTTGARVTEPPVSTSTPAPVCAIGLPPRLVDVSRALQLAERIETTPENGVLLSGGGRRVLLFSQ